MIPFAAEKLSVLLEMMKGRIFCSPAVPFVMNEKSLPGDEKTSNMPNSADAVTSGTARIATFSGLSNLCMAEMTVFQLI